MIPLTGKTTHQENWTVTVMVTAMGTVIATATATAGMAVVAVARAMVVDVGCSHSIADDNGSSDDEGATVVVAVGEVVDVECRSDE